MLSLKYLFHRMDLPVQKLGNHLANTHAVVPDTAPARMLDASFKFHFTVPDTCGN